MKKLLFLLCSTLISLVCSAPLLLIDFSEIDVAEIPGYASINWNEIAKRCQPFNNAPELAPYFNYFKHALQLETAIETGTWQGETTKCLALLFPTVHTVEFQLEVFKKAKNTFRPYPNIKLYHGNSPKVLNQILPILKSKRALFYLDAHWFSDWPLLEELETIGQTHYDNCVIVIDDIKVPGREDIPYNAYNEPECSYDYVQSMLSHVFSAHTYFYLIPKSPASRAKLVILPQTWIDSLKHVKAIKHQIPNFSSFVEKAGQPLSGWAKAQIKEDLSFFKNRTISFKKLNDFYEDNSHELQLIKFTIRSNKVSAEWKFDEAHYRRSVFQEILSALSDLLPLPDTVFLLSMHDGFNCSEDIPVFGMCKKQQSYATIAIPDYDALKGNFQVLPGKDLLTYDPPWNTKMYNKLIWRGSTTQAAITADNFNKLSRVTVCKLSLQYPSLIDAKFTNFCQGGESIPFLQTFRGNWLSPEEQFPYKYHIVIDGNAAPYQRSCWKLFSNSLIFKPNSVHIQWYYKGLEPWKHYVPVKENLSDLVEKIHWAQAHDKEAEIMAHNLRSFVVNNLSAPDNLLYLYRVLWEYSHLNFTD